LNYLTLAQNAADDLRRTRACCEKERGLLEAACETLERVQLSLEVACDRLEHVQLSAAITEKYLSELLNEVKKLNVG
jgi:hypothetical protein